MKILTVVGARPQFVKAAVVSRAIRSQEGLGEVLVHTGQHYDANMSEVFFEEMEIPRPNYNLEVGSGHHGAMTGRMLEKLESLMLEEKPDVVLVYGDTNSTLAGALAAAKLHIPVAHVEAGLRSFNMKMPEEVNRILTDNVSRWLFCPSGAAVTHLKNEGFSDEKIFQLGDVMCDAALFYMKKATGSAEAKPIVDQYSSFYLCTVHRQENTDSVERISNIFKGLDEISEDTQVIMPLHPRTEKTLKDFSIQVDNVKFIKPVGYFDMLYLLNNSSGVLTDSGGLQKEAYFCSKPCVTMRDETEWVETVELGVNKIVGADYDKIIAAHKWMKQGGFDFAKKPYGGGDAGVRIIEAITRCL